MPFKDPTLHRDSQRRSDAKYRLTHPESKQASRVKWRTANKEKERQLQKVYRKRYLERHPDSAAQHDNRRRARERNALGQHTRQEWKAKSRAIGRCVYCGNCRVHLTRDHIVPLVKGGTDSIDNIVPACRSCNSRKGTSLIALKQKYMRNANPKVSMHSPPSCDGEPTRPPRPEEMVAP